VLRGPIEPARTREPAGAQAGWVSDLLRGASRDEAVAPETGRAPARRTGANVADPLNSLSVDIARAIDHDASIELWDRYRRGEKNVFTRRLYTLKGQQTFDEVRRKYQAEPEFRSAVDRYCDDFEKLLRDIGRNDRENVMTQTYLTSDTGKVYTMLAHASGRLR
jgi:acyl transferase domain-containing protein